MKAKELLAICCRNGVNLEDFQVVDIESPLEDCARLFREYKACVLPSPGSYLVEWCDFNRSSQIGNPDALFVLDASPAATIHLFQILLFRID